MCIFVHYLQYEPRSVKRGDLMYLRKSIDLGQPAQSAQDDLGQNFLFSTFSSIQRIMPQ